MHLLTRHMDRFSDGRSLFLSGIDRRVSTDETAGPVGAKI
jgi:hypothetical protein